MLFGFEVVVHVYENCSAEHVSSLFSCPQRMSADIPSNGWIVFEQVTQYMPFLYESLYTIAVKVLD